MVNKKNGKDEKRGGHRPEEEDGIVYEDPWMWEDEEQAKLQLQQDPAKDLTPRDDDAGK